MGALVATIPARTGTTTAGAAVAASDTISSNIIGSRGAFLEIINGSASVDNITISDASVTGTGAAAAANAPSVNAGAAKIFLIHPRQVDPVSGVVTVTHSQVPTVTYKLYPR